MKSSDSLMSRLEELLILVLLSKYFKNWTMMEVELSYWMNSFRTISIDKESLRREFNS